MKTKRIADINAAAETLYLFVTAAYVLKASFDTTLFHIPWPGNYEEVLRTLACAVVFLKICGCKAYSEKTWLAGILTCILFKLSWESTGYTFLLDTALLIAGAVNVPYKKILKIGFGVGLYTLLLAMFGSFTGCIADLVYSKMSGVFRHSFGIVYPTDFAAHVTFLFLTGWVLYGSEVFILPLTWSLGAAIFVYYYSGAKCSTAVLLLHAAVIIFFFFTEKYKGTYKTAYRLAEHSGRILPYVMPLGAMLMIGLTLLYNEENVWMQHINHLLNSRLSLGQTAADAYGITLFGTAFDLIGAGGNITTRLDYNFVDISYVLILVRYGLAVLLTLCIHYIWIEQRALKNGQRKLALAAAVVAVHSMIEHHLPELSYNLFLLLPFADFTDCLRQNSTAVKSRMTLQSVLPRTAVLITGAVAAAAFPRAIGYMKTLVDILHLDSPENNVLFIGIITAVFLTAIDCLRMVSGIVGLLVRKKPLPKTSCIRLAAAVSVLLYALCKGEQIICQGTEEYQELLEADRSAIEALAASEESVGSLYIDYIPEIYRREFKNISSRIFSAEGAAMETDATLFTEDSQKLKALIYAGYEYGEIAPGHAVYTNSEAAKNILKAAGVVLTPYYSRQYTLTPEEIALWNNFELTKDGQLLLSGASQSLTHGPGVTIYGGKLQVTYQLQLKENIMEENPAATARITSEGGQRILGQGEINLTDFNENGQCTFTVAMRLYNNYPDVEFLLFLSDGVTLEIQGIDYGEVR